MPKNLTRIGIGAGSDSEAPQTAFIDHPGMPRPLMMLSVACLTLLSSCAATVAVNPPIAEPSTKSPVTQPQVERDYQDGYPFFAPAPKARADGSLQSFLALNTGPYLANHNVHNLTWTNNSGRTLAIYKAYLWTGVDKGAIADVHLEARRGSDNSYIGILQWDHYADPTLPQHGQQFDYASPMMLDQGDTIAIQHFANGFEPGWHAHHVLILWVK